MSVTITAAGAVGEYAVLLCSLGLVGGMGMVLRCTPRGRAVRGYAHLVWRRMRRGLSSRASRQVRFAAPQNDAPGEDDDDDENEGDGFDIEGLPPEIVVAHKSHTD